MAINYQQAGGDTLNLLDEVVRDYHPEKQDLRVGIIFCTSVDKKGEMDGKPSLKNCGFPAAAKVSLVSAKDRIHKKLDVMILIDGAGWSQMSVAQQRAILDHEMEHVQIDPDAEPSDDGRPKLVMKEEDYCLWGFRSVAARHGNDSMEVATAKQVMDLVGDVLWKDHSATMLRAARSNTRPNREEGSTALRLPAPTDQCDGPDSAIDFPKAKNRGPAPLAPKFAVVEDEEPDGEEPTDADDIKIELDEVVRQYKSVEVKLLGESNTVQVITENSNGLVNKNAVAPEGLLDNPFVGMKVKKVEAGIRLANGSVKVVPGTIKLVRYK